MSQDNVELVKSIYAAFLRRDMDEVLRKLAPDFEMGQSAELPWGGQYRGARGLRDFFGKLRQHLNNRALPIERYLDAGDRVVAIGRTQGTVLANGREFDVPLAHVWEVRTGAVVGFWPYIDNVAMLAAMA